MSTLVCPCIPVSTREYPRVSLRTLVVVALRALPCLGPPATASRATDGPCGARHCSRQSALLESELAAAFGDAAGHTPLAANAVRARFAEVRPRGFVHPTGRTALTYGLHTAHYTGRKSAVVAAPLSGVRPLCDRSAARSGRRSSATVKSPQQRCAAFRMPCAQCSAVQLQCYSVPCRTWHSVTVPLCAAAHGPQTQRGGRAA